MEDFQFERGHMTFFAASIQESVRQSRDQGEGVNLFFADTVLLPSVEEELVSDDKYPIQMNIVVMGANESVYTMLGANQIQFAFDHQWYMEGYLPVALLAQGNASLDNALLQSPPADRVRNCQANLFPVCPNTEGGVLDD